MREKGKSVTSMCVSMQRSQGETNQIHTAYTAHVLFLKDKADRREKSEYVWRNLKNLTVENSNIRTHRHVAQTHMQ